MARHKPLLKPTQPLDQRRVAPAPLPQAKYTRRLRKRSWAQYTLDVRRVPDRGKWITALIVVVFTLIAGGVTAVYVADGIQRAAASAEQARVDLLYRSQPTLPFSEATPAANAAGTPLYSSLVTPLPGVGEYPPLAALDDPSWIRVVLTPVSGTFTIYDRPQGGSIGSVNATGAAYIITNPAWNGWMMVRIGDMRAWIDSVDVRVSTE